MATIRVRGVLEEHYTMIPNDLIRSIDVSHKAVRIFAYLKSHCEGWETNVRSVGNALGMSKNTVNDAIQELEQLGYVVREWESAEAGGIRQGIEYVLFDTPQSTVSQKEGHRDGSVSLSTVSQFHGVPKTGTYKKNNSFKKNNTKEEQSPLTPQGDDGDSSFDAFWDAYGKKVDKPAAKRAWAKAVKKTTADAIIKAATTYIHHQRETGKHPQFTRNPATWLNGEGWDDEIIAPIPETEESWLPPEYRRPRNVEGRVIDHDSA